jgi:hypothetical protein
VENQADDISDLYIERLFSMESDAKEIIKKREDLPGARRCNGQMRGCGQRNRVYYREVRLICFCPSANHTLADQIPSMTFLVVVIALALIFDYINGFHDAANSIATIVSTKCLRRSRR